MRIRYVSHFGPEGQFVAAKRLMLALVRQGVELTWTPMVAGDGWGLNVEPFAGRRIGDPDLDQFCNRPLPHDTTIVHLRPVFYPRWAALEQGKRVIGHTVWETDRLPRHWPRLLRHVSDILVPCRWNRQVFEDGGAGLPVHVVPHIAPPHTTDAPADRIGSGADDGAFVFYTIGTWTARKAIPLLLDCYLETFTGSDHTVLVLKTTEHTYAQSWHLRLRRARRVWASLRRLLPLPVITPRAGARERVAELCRGQADAPRVRVITECVPDAEITRLHVRGDCFVSLSRGEGWCLPAFDAASCGTPVIITGFGGQMDYLDADHAGIVGYDLVPVRDDDDPATFTPDQRWAEPRLGEASALMRQAYSDRKAWRERAAALRSRIIDTYTEAKVASALLATLTRR